MKAIGKIKRGLRGNFWTKGKRISAN